MHACIYIQRKYITTHPSYPILSATSHPIPSNPIQSHPIPSPPSPPPYLPSPPYPTTIPKHKLSHAPYLDVPYHLAECRHSYISIVHHRPSSSAIKCVCHQVRLEILLRRYRYGTLPSSPYSTASYIHIHTHTFIPSTPYPHMSPFGIHAVRPTVRCTLEPQAALIIVR